MSNTKYLTRLGLTNYDSEDLGTLAMAETQTVFLYYCTSDKCRGRAEKKEKFPKRNKDVCPDCGHALFTKRRGK